MSATQTIRAALVLRDATAPSTSSGSVAPQDERTSLDNSAHPEEALSLSKCRLEGPTQHERMSLVWP